jgi:hypothetical protein
MRIKEDRAGVLWPACMACMALLQKVISMWTTLLRLQHKISVLRIRDIFLRIRIPGSIHLITDTEPALFYRDFQDANQKVVLLF